MVVATGASTPTVTKTLITQQKPLLILDLSIPKNVAEEVQELPNVTVIHLDTLSKLADDTIERRKKAIPDAMRIIEEMKAEFLQWLDRRKFAPTIQALKSKLEGLKLAEIDFQRKKIEGFNEQQAELISNRIIQKITTQFVNHLKEAQDMEESVNWLQQVFQLEVAENG
jgi:glutamyl-tRNA reductase 1